MKHLHLLLVILLFNSIILVYSQTEINDGLNLTKSNDCNLPCFNELIPGVSTLEAVEHFLNHLTEYNTYDNDTSHVYVSPRQGSETRHSFSWTSDGYKNEVNHILVDDNILYRIRIHPSELTFLEDVITYLGVPVGMYVEYEFSRELDFDYVPTQLRLYYPKFGTVVVTDLIIPDSRVIEVLPSLEITYFEIYQDTESIQDFASVLTNFPEDDTKLNQYINTIDNDWVGYNSLFVSGQSIRDGEYQSFIVQPISGTGQD